MKNFSAPAIVITLALITLIFSKCNQHESSSGINQDTGNKAAVSYGGFESPVKWGEHLITVGGCNDCHTPKIMTSTGPQSDSSSQFSGHPSNMPPPAVDRKEIERKRLSVTQTLTSWVGPWGISYAANITSDSTGIGNWTEEQFIRCLREGKLKGLTGSRQLLPPMPVQQFSFMQDDELKAMFAYLKSTKPIKNVVPPPASPVLTAGK